MTKTTTTVLTVAALYLAVPAQVAAQTAQMTGPESYVGVTVGAQPQRRTVSAVATSTVFNKTATFTADHRVGNGPFYDVSAGHRVSRTITVGVAVSSFDTDGSAAGTASIPDPIVVGKFSSVALEGRNMNRGERAFHLQGVWFRPVSRKIDVAVSAGPSLFYVSQEFVSGSAAEGSSTVTYAAESQAGLGFGLNVGADATWLLTPRYGVGLLLRYTWGKVALDAANVTAGGVQGGLGLRVRF